MSRRLELAIASMALSALAHANGRPPLTNGVYLQRTDPQAIYVRTTFGFLISHDAGCSFRWTCEQNIGYGGMFDPNYAIADDGTLFATTNTGLHVSRDGGCSFTTATEQLPITDPGRIADTYVTGIDIAATGEIWVVSADPSRANDAFRSTDGGATFAPRGLGSLMRWWNSVKVAPSDAQRVYVAGYQLTSAGDAGSTPTAHLMVTTDGGQGWTEASLAGVQVAATPLLVIAAVDPADPQRLFVISVGGNGNGDRLYRSTNGGTSFTEVLATTQPITGFVLHDAMTAIAASGSGGTFSSSDGGASFTPLAGAPQLACLGQKADGTLIGCAANWDPDFMAVAVSSDAAHWEKMFRFIELDGTLACEPGTVAHDVCDQQQWPVLSQQFGATGPMCATATDLPMSTPDGLPPTKPGGCCDAGDGAPGTVVLAVVSLGLIWHRRKRSTKMMV